MSIDKTDVNLTLLTAFKNSNFIIVGEKALQAANEASCNLNLF